MKHIKLFENFLNEDWGSSDQWAMNNSMHKDLGNPTKAPFLDDVLSAAESAVDFYWNDWEEYKTDRDGLINKAAKLYYRAKFPEYLEGMQKLFAPKNEGEVSEITHLPKKTGEVKLFNKNDKGAKKDVKVGDEHFVDYSSGPFGGNETFKVTRIETNGDVFGKSIKGGAYELDPEDVI